MTNEEFAVSCSRLAFVGSRASFSSWSSSSILGRVVRRYGCASTTDLPRDHDFCTRRPRPPITPQIEDEDEDDDREPCTANSPSPYHSWPSCAILPANLEARFSLGKLRTRPTCCVLQAEGLRVTLPILILCRLRNTTTMRAR